MDELKIGVVESRFADLVWSNEPLSSGKLVEICNKELGWKKSTTYTVLKKLSLRGIFCNDGGIVKALMTRDEFYGIQSRQFVDENFDGSLPSFIAAFAAGKKISEEESKQIKKLVDELCGDNHD
ncbi:MAG: BlaI/MecI/CopY family transcriptional regulator [Clostridia bacterium]|nr:BlaI/MecI/CopY family transcriptional regulator [Clostridia bacterium]